MNPWLVRCGALCLAWHLGPAGAEQIPGLVRERAEARRTFLAAARERIAVSPGSDSPSNSEARQAFQAWLLPYQTRRRWIPLLDPLSPTVEATPLGQRLSALRTEHAARIYQLVSRAEKRSALQCELLLEVLRENPGHADARRQLRNLLPSLQTSLRPPRIRQGRTREPRLGWAPGNYWRAASQHYQLLTNGDPAPARELIGLLERLRACWQPLFVDVATVRGSRPSATLRVVLFADRQQYARHLETVSPQIASTLGYYDPRRRTCYFYQSPQDTQATVLHEATHQLFHAATNPAQPIAEHRGFWLVEGVALYMESCQFGPGYACVGGGDARRLQFARYRALQESFYLPISRLDQIGRTQFQSHPDMRKLYSQSAGLVHFLMDGQQGAYRQRLMNHLATTYQLREANHGATSVLTDLDDAYRNYLNTDDQAVTQLLPRKTNALCFGKTSLTAEGLQRLAEYHQLDWLDLAELPLTDALFRKFPDQPVLRQLNLEETEIGDASLPRILNWKRIQELDLSGTRLTDQGLANLRGLTELRSLWLTRTSVSDAAIDMLLQMRDLAFLDIRGTRISEAGLARLVSGLPDTEISAR